MTRLWLKYSEAFRQDPVDILAIRSRGDQSVGYELCFWFSFVVVTRHDVRAPVAAGFVIAFDRCSMTLLGRKIAVGLFEI